MTKPIEDSTNAAAIRTALGVPTTAALDAKYTKPSGGIPATDLDADPAGRVLLTAASASERKQVLGLDQVNNTSDASKPISTAQQTALDAKMAATLSAMHTAFDAGTAPQKAAFQSSVSGGVTVDPSAWMMQTPGLMSSPPAITPGVAGAASAIAGSVAVSALQAGAFSFLGGPRPRGLYYPADAGVRIGKWAGTTSPSPAAVEFVLDNGDSTGQFEIETAGNGGKYRVLIFQYGNWQRVTEKETRVVPSDGKLYIDLVTLGAAAVYQVRIEFSGDVRFRGLRVGVGTGVAARRAARRFIVVGNSYTEPDINDTNPWFVWDGYVQQLSYLTGYDMWSAGSGGTGYVATGPAGMGRQKFRDRLPEVLTHGTDIIFAGGINDSASDLATFTSEVAACFDMVIAAGGTVHAISPFWPQGIAGQPATLRQYADVIRAQCARVGGKYIDVLSMGVPDFLSGYASFETTATATRLATQNTIEVAARPEFFNTAGAGVDKWYVLIGDGAAQVAREVITQSGSGPYTLGLSTTIGIPVSVGTRVRLTGPSYISGTGKQGATNGSGTADRYTGNDGTHPTAPGHANLARSIALRWAQVR